MKTSTMKMLATAMIALSTSAYAQKELVPLKDTISMDTFEGRKPKTVTLLSVKDGMYEAVYFYNGKTHKSAVPIDQRSFYNISSWSWIPSVSVVTVPFKVRPKQDGLPQNANTSLKSVGLLVGPYYKSERYFATGKISTHKFSANLLLAPAAEVFNPGNTGGKVAESSQLVLSTGLAFTYTYNSISFAIIPLAADYGMTDDAKSWIYNKKRWFGFGIGIDTKLFGF